MPAGESAGIKMPTSCTMSPKCDPVTITGVTHNSPQETKTKSEKTCGIRSHTNIYLSFLLRTNINCHRHKKIKPILNWLGGNMSNLEPRQYSIFGNKDDTDTPTSIYQPIFFNVRYQKCVPKTWKRGRICNLTINFIVNNLSALKL